MKAKTLLKVLSVMTAAFMCVGSFSYVPYVVDNIGITVSASTGTYGDMTYNNMGSTVTITDCDENATYIVIPEELDGVPVTAIGNSAFAGCTKLKGVIVPDSVTAIGEAAFQKCTSLIEVDIADSVKSIGLNAFEGCAALPEITIPKSVTSISGYMLADCTSLKKVNLSDTLLSIGYNAFEGCVKLNNFVIPENVQTIGSSAFQGCTSLESIAVPDAVLSIGDSAFENCTSLKSATLGNKLKVLGGLAFADCISLKSLNIPATVTSIGDGVIRDSQAMTSLTVQIGNKVYTAIDNVLYTADKTELIAYPAGKTKYSYNVLKTTTNIHPYAFYGNINLTEVTFPNTLETIGDYAFYSDDGTTNIEKIYYYNDLLIEEPIKSGFTEMFYKSQTFSGSGDIPYIVDDTLYYYNVEDFSSIETMEEIAAVQKLESTAYEIKLESGGGYKFLCLIPEGDRESVIYFLYNYSDDYVEKYGNYVSLSCDKNLSSGKITNIESLLSCTDDEFIDYCINFLTYGPCNPSYEINEEELGYYYVDDEMYQQLGEIALFYVDENDVVCIEFMSKADLPSNTMSASEIFMSEIAFDNTKNVFGEIINTYYPILDTTENETDALESGSFKYHKYTGNNVGICGFDTTQKVAQFPDKIDRLSITAVEDKAFYKCNDLEKVILSDDVQTIGEYAFYFNSELESVYIPYSVSEIGDNAFAGCTDLRDVYFNGTEDEWNAITMGINNECLKNAIIHYNSTGSELLVGNANGDDKVDIADAVLLKNYLLKKQELTAEQFQNADLTKDDKVNVFDLMALRRILLA